MIILRCETCEKGRKKNSYLSNSAFLHQQDGARVIIKMGT